MSDNNEDKELKYIEPFKYQILQSFPFIADDFDQLTAYGLFCKLSDKMNEVVANNNNLNDDMLLYIQKFNNLKAYVDTYFDNLDVQNEINEKLDTMARDGSLEPILEGVFTNYYDDTMQEVDSKLETKVDKNGVGQVTMNNLSQDVKEALTGGSVAVVGYDTIGDFNVMDGSISYSKLNKNGRDGVAGLNITKNLNVDFEQGTRHQTGSLQVVTNTVVTKKTFKPKPRN